MTPLAYWTARFLLGLAVLVVSGLGAPSTALAQMLGNGHYALAEAMVGIVGFWCAITAVTPLVRLLGADARLRSEWGSAAFAAFADMSAPQRVFLLLLAVAEADGKSGATELELVRTFLRARFVDPAQRADVDTWVAKLRPPRDLTGLARLVARDLGAGERGTMYSWCCTIAFADGGLRAEEFRALQQVANGLGLSAPHAQFLFEFAQQSAEQRQRNGTSRPSSTDAGKHGSDQRRAPPPPPPQPPRPRGTPREQALATLGLPPDATADAIRRRHRELVRRFHPDAHRTLGPIAQQEATERFLAIQKAYELLTGN